jgi:hypothetical protein
MPFPLGLLVQVPGAEMVHVEPGTDAVNVTEDPTVVFRVLGLTVGGAARV